MARRKRDEEEELDFDEPPIDDEPVEDDLIEDEPVEDDLIEDEPVDDEEPRAEAEEPEEEEEEEDVDAPPGRGTPIFTIILLFLNFLAAGPFVVLLAMDYAARYQWTYAAFMNRVYVWGLPLAEEEASASASTATRPRLRIDGDRIKAIYSDSTKHPKPQGTASVSDPFQPVDTADEPIAFRVRPSQIDDQVKDSLFKANGLSDPVATLEDEVDRLKKTVPGQMEAAADKFVADQGSAEKKLAAARVILLPLAWSPKQVDDLEKKIETAGEAKGASLDQLLKDAVLRRMLADVLAPMNIYRPGDVKQFSVEKIAETPIDELMGLLQNRFDEAISAKHLGVVHLGEAFNDRDRDPVEKRHTIAFLMVDLARLHVPGAKEPLLPKGLERAQVVCGLQEFAQAAGNYARTLAVLHGRVLYAIETDREGYVVRAKDLTRTASGFVDQHAADIQRLKKVVADIRFTKNRITELQAQRDRYKKQVEERLVLLGEVTTRVKTARGETHKAIGELHELEKELFAAQVELSDAAERNARLEAQIDAAERKLRGGKKQ